MSNDLYFYSIIDYSAKTKISVSTLRRRIRSGKLIHKVIDGKYYIYDEDLQNLEYNLEDFQKLMIENRELKRKVLKYKEEIAELKMLIEIYEKSQLRQNSQLPPAHQSYENLVS